MSAMASPPPGFLDWLRHQVDLDGNVGALARSYVAGCASTLEALREIQVDDDGEATEYSIFEALYWFQFEASRTARRAS